MEPIVSPWFIYGIHIADKLIHVFQSVSMISTAIFMTSLLIGLMSSFDGDMLSEKMTAYGRKVIKYSAALFMVSGLLSVLIPTREVMLQMLVANLVTPDNIQAVQDNIIQFISETAKAIAHAE